MTSVEHIAQAMAGDEWRLLEPRLRQVYRDMARRALLALREPSPEMVDAALDTMDANPKGGVQSLWRSMVDAALAAPEGSE